MNYFTLFNLPEEIPVDLTLLKQRYQSLQKQFHPDQFAHQTEQERLCAIKKSADINLAYQTLKHPLQSVEYFITLQGVDIQAEQTLHDIEFLEKQLELREELDAISHAEKSDSFSLLNAFSARVVTLEKSYKQALMDALCACDFTQAGNRMRQLYFFDKLRKDISQLEEHYFS